MSSKKLISPHTLFNSNTDTSQHFRLFLDDIIHEGAQMHEILNVLHDAGDNDTLELRINSGGGYVKYGQQLINVIKGKFEDRCLTVIESDACSMAALIFMAGTSRVIYEHSILMVHDISMYLAGKASQSKKQLEAETFAFRSRFLSLFCESLSSVEIDGIFDGKDEWFNAEEMCKRGMATHVITETVGMVSAEEFIDMLNNKESRLLSKLKEESDKYASIVEELQSSIDTYKEKLININKQIEDLSNEDSCSGQTAE